MHWPGAARNDALGKAYGGLILPSAPRDIVLRNFLVILSLFVLTAAGWGNGVKLAFFEITPEGRNLAVKWQMEEELDIREYALTRKTPYSNEQFVEVQLFQPHGPGVPYEYLDDQVYKSASDLVDYRLEAVYTSGLREVVVTKSVNYTSTAVRRTWGSIKAMFQ